MKNELKQKQVDFLLEYSRFNNYCREYEESYELLIKTEKKLAEESPTDKEARLKHVAALKDEIQKLNDEFDRNDTNYSSANYQISDRLELCYNELEEVDYEGVISRISTRVLSSYGRLQQSYYALKGKHADFKTYEDAIMEARNKKQQLIDDYAQQVTIQVYGPETEDEFTSEMIADGERIARRDFSLYAPKSFAPHEEMLQLEDTYTKLVAPVEKAMIEADARTKTIVKMQSDLNKQPTKK